MASLSAEAGRDAGDRSAGPVEVREQADVRVLVLQGDWTAPTLLACERAISTEVAAPPARLRFDLAKLMRIDTAGAWLIQREVKACEAAGTAVEVTGATEAVATLLATVTRHDVEHPPIEPPDVNPVVAMIERLGAGTFSAMHAATELVNFLGLLLVTLGRCLVQPRRLRLVSVVSHMESTGLNAMPIVGLLSFLIGIVLAYQSADQLAKFGAQIFTVNIVGVAMLREMGVILTAIIVAGRSGSAFTAQIGTMKVNQEVDAMTTIGLDPIEVLVVPRVIALTITLPLLTFYAVLMGLLGGAVMANAALDITFVQFLRQLNNAVTLGSFWFGVLKALPFAFVIAMVGCFEGLKVKGDAASVGEQTTRSVVESIFLVIVIDAVLSVFASVVGI
ncbi:MAG: MlaE family lipid ABC transporter permease subunit [Kiloniellales bacterium]|nr:MlaE family lipid ABC transporter permease subunit [Kiloniellales bacterium]MDJ0970457.1 MlaE family lipid ABC transporter permease subunit [Kiloniellales bacterium]